MNQQSSKERASRIAALRQWVMRRVPLGVLAVLVFALALAALAAGITWLVGHEDAALEVDRNQTAQKQQRLQKRNHHE